MSSSNERLESRHKPIHRQASTGGLSTAPGTLAGEYGEQPDNGQVPGLAPTERIIG